MVSSVVLWSFPLFPNVTSFFGRYTRVGQLIPAYSTAQWRILFTVPFPGWIFRTQWISNMEWSGHKRGFTCGVRALGELSVQGLPYPPWGSSPTSLRFHRWHLRPPSQLWAGSLAPPGRSFLDTNTPSGFVRKRPFPEWERRTGCLCKQILIPPQCRFINLQGIWSKGGIWIPEPL